MNTSKKSAYFRKFGLGLILVWTCILAAILSFIINEYRKDTINDAIKQARNYFELNLYYRRWASENAGVYVPHDKIADNPYVSDRDNDVKTDSGKPLTFINPDYMTRMVFDAIQKQSQQPIISKVVSLRQANPSDVFNAWELETVRLYENSTCRERLQNITIKNQPYLQFMSAFTIEESCLKCHFHAGHKIGDVCGGMSIAIPTSGYLAKEAERIQTVSGAFTLLWVIGCFGIAASARRRHQQEMKILEEKSRAEELSERYTIVADGIPWLISHVDVTERYIYVNKAYADWVELSKEQIVGKSVKEIIGETNYEITRPYIRQAVKGAPGCLERRTSVHGREIVQILNFIPKKNSMGETISYFTLINDITDLKKLELAILEDSRRLEEEISDRRLIQFELEEQADRLKYESEERRQAEEELQKKNAEIEQFIYTVSHDLRSPLVTVKTFMGFLENDMAEGNLEQLDRDIQFIHSAADKMKLMLDELLEMSRIGRVESLPVRVSFSEVINEVLIDMGGLISERNADIQLINTDLLLFWERPRLCQIWQNLIENAIKYTCDDSIPQLELGVDLLREETVFFVKDNGIGIDPRHQSKIFGIFDKLDSQSPGAGLGLSMVQRIVESCGGRIWVESEGSGTGSSFFFTLPKALI